MLVGPIFFLGVMTLRQEYLPRMLIADSVGVVGSRIETKPPRSSCC